MTYNVSNTDKEARGYKTFKLHSKEEELLKEVLTARLGDVGMFVYPKALWEVYPSEDESWKLYRLAWEVVASYHYAVVETICAHPDGLPYFLAKEAPRMRTRKGGTGGGFEDDEHHTPNR